MNNDNLTNEQMEFLSDLFTVLHSSKPAELNKGNILEKLQDEIILTMRSYWGLVDQINELKQNLNNQLYL